jgi:2-phosphoglycerate kinase
VTSRRPWEVLLIGGASGTGKTRVAYPLAQQLGVGITQVDDLYVVLERMTTVEQQPALHFWPTHPDPGSLSPKQIQEQGVDILRVMMPALDAVVANHLEEGTPVIMEGDFIHPALVAQASFGEQPNGGRVRGVFLYEENAAQIVRNFSEREPETGPQTTRAEVSALWARWIREQCSRYGVPAITARPWHTLSARVLDALRVSSEDWTDGCPDPPRVRPTRR